ncbi:MAG: large conductance mechanosensitive channel protein MscL [Legionellaceae bacterium]|nr:large conductance mechanosensitive channel protein MscL [Legionellaceae bacterium]
MGFISDFKEFAMRGNVIDLAVAVVIGASFEKIVSSLVDGIIMPILGWLSGGINITDKVATIGDVTIKWGDFLQSVINFSIISFSIFVAIKIIHAMHKKENKVIQKISEEAKILREIRDLIKK